MDKFVPFDKLSKRKKRELLAKRRKTWEGLSPVTRRPANPKAYDRNDAKRSEAHRDKTRGWGDDDSSAGAFFNTLLR